MSLDHFAANAANRFDHDARVRLVRERALREMWTALRRRLRRT